ncbi:MAG TPA: hypothetical protein VI565_06575 [Burkholderiales bacterium]|nr:hypothetical protein [Burkholderiales bacterium]
MKDGTKEKGLVALAFSGIGCVIIMHIAFWGSIVVAAVCGAVWLVKHV